MANMMQMMAKAQKFKARAEDVQTQVNAMTIDGQAAGGSVTAQAKGRRIISLNVNVDLVQAGEKDVMEDLVIAAVNNALDNTDKIMQEEMQKLMAELGLPANMADML